MHRLAAMHRSLAEVHRRLAKEALLDVVQQYHLSTDRQTRAIRRLRHPLPATGESYGRSPITHRPQRDGRRVAEAGGSRRLELVPSPDA